MRVSSVELEYKQSKQLMGFLHKSVKCQADFGMSDLSDVDQFLAPVSDVGLKKWAISGVGKHLFMGPKDGC